MSADTNARKHAEASPALMGVDLQRLVRLCIANHTPEELALGWLRYECVRKMSARDFGELCKRNISGENFDNMVNGAIMDWQLTHEPNL